MVRQTGSQDLLEVCVVRVRKLRCFILVHSVLERTVDSRVRFPSVFVDHVGTSLSTTACCEKLREECISSVEGGLETG